MISHPPCGTTTTIPGTTTIVGQEGPTTTAGTSPSSTDPVVPSTASGLLPSTGSDSGSTAMVGLFFLAFGAVLIALSRPSRQA